MSRQRLVKTCLLLLAGGLAAQHTTLPLVSDFISLLLVASLWLLLVRRARALACGILGFALFMLAGDDVISKRLDPRFEGDSMLAIVQVTDFPKVTGDSVSIVVTPLGDARIPPRSHVSWFEPPVIPAIGEIWELELRLRRPRGSFNPGVFDYESWLFREKVHATGYVVGGKRNRLLRAGMADEVDAFRERFVARAQAAAATDSAAAVLAAVGVGARHLVSREQWDRFALSGTSHLMAISGLHVGLAALASFALMYVVLGPFCTRGNHYVVAMACGVLFAATYALLSGFGVPARRATLMLGLAAVTVMRRRQVSPPVILAGAAIAVYAADPIATLTPGFHLSFGAVVLLLWLAQRKIMRRYRLFEAPRQLVVMQVFLMFGLLPLTALLFQRYAVMATPVNLVAVPLFSFVTVPLTLAGMLVGEWSESSALQLLRLAAVTVDGLDMVTARIVSLPGADLRLAQMSGPACALLLLPLAWVVLPRGWPGRGLAVLGVLVIVTWKPPSPPAACFDAHVLDVGQGLAVVIETELDVTVYDTGMAWRGGGSIAEQVIVPFLQARGTERIERLIVSHSDLDHSGGVAVLRKALEVRHLLAGEDLPATDAWSCASGQAWWSGAIRFEILHPLPEAPREGNDSSCVLRVSAGAYSLLLTGDIEASAERELLQRDVALGANVVVVPHHGSTTSSSAPFVASVDPGIAVVSAGYANRWGFPKPLVVARWQDTGAELLNTGASGAVTVRVCADRGVVKLGTERERRRRFWHAKP